MIIRKANKDWSWNIQNGSMIFFNGNAPLYFYHYPFETKIVIRSNQTLKYHKDGDYFEIVEV